MDNSRILNAFALWFLRQQRQQVQRSDSELCLNFLYVFTDSFEVLFELSGFTYFLRHLIDAIKLSTLSILTMPASSPLSASFIAESVVSFGKVIVVISPNIYISDYYNVGGCALFCATTTISVGKDMAFYLKHKIILVLFVCMDCKNCVSFHNTTQGRCLFCFFQDKKGNVRSMRGCVVISCASAGYGAAIARGRG